ncbi:MAG: HAD family hydrolase [Chloroflexi bacterium]|nr:HAD family hydrolase [Chloroflexota bacterium]
MKARAVMFDWDGTLIHSLDYKIRNGGILFSAQYNVSARDVEDSYRRHSGIPRRDLFAAICRELSLPPLDENVYAEFSARFSEMNRRILLDPATPGLLDINTRPVLQAMADAGCILFVSSSAEQKEIIDVAHALGLDEIISASGGEILGSHPGFSKGEQHVNHVRSMHPFGLAEIAFVGDEPTDIALARQAGVLTIAKTGTYTAKELAAYKPDAVIHEFAELISILGISAPPVNEPGKI